MILASHTPTQGISDHTPIENGTENLASTIFKKTLTVMRPHLTANIINKTSYGCIRYFSLPVTLLVDLAWKGLHTTASILEAPQKYITNPIERNLTLPKIHSLLEFFLKQIKEIRCLQEQPNQSDYKKLCKQVGKLPLNTMAVVIGVPLDFVMIISYTLIFLTTGLIKCMATVLALFKRSMELDVFDKINCNMSEVLRQPCMEILSTTNTTR